MVANATNRSGWAAQISASVSFWMRISSFATSRSAVYQYGLMLRASTSIPCWSMARMRSAGLDMRRASVSSALPISAMALGTAQCACTSTVFTRLPATTTSRRRPWGAADPLHETNAASAMACPSVGDVFVVRGVIIRHRASASHHGAQESVDLGLVVVVVDAGAHEGVDAARGQIEARGARLRLRDFDAHAAQAITSCERLLAFFEERHDLALLDPEIVNRDARTLRQPFTEHRSEHLDARLDRLDPEGERIARGHGQ